MKLQRWPILYKKGKSGKIQQWEIYVRGNVIHSAAGQVGGKLTETSDTIKVGKNLGRSNETSPHEQAVFEAQAKFDKKQDLGYVEDLEAAGRGEIHDKVEGAFFPMLAEKYSEKRKHIVFPAYVQPKLDGLRAVWSNGFFSRTRKPFKALKHIERELVRLGIDHFQLDGELYNHDLKDNFEDLVSAIKRGKTEHPLVHKIQYHIYDVHIPGEAFSLRWDKLRQLKKRLDNSTTIQLVQTSFMGTEEAMMELYEEFMEQGYEGAMVRNSHGIYQYGPTSRSKDLQKIKIFEDDEFKVIGIKEGRGKLQGHVGKFVCVIEDPLGDDPPREFEVKPKGEGVTKFLKEAFENESLWKGKWLKVQFQGYTKKNRVPRFPVGLNFRDAE